MKSPGYVQLCKEIAGKVIVTGAPYEQLESRLRALTIATLLPQRSYGADEIADYYARDFLFVDACWHEAISSMMQTIDQDQAGTLEREFGCQFPKFEKAVTRLAHNDDGGKIPSK